VKIVLSRKGFDSACGGVASPIFPDGGYVSLPIPLPEPLTYEAIGWRGGTLGPLVERLTRGRVRADDGTHLDPDLRADALPRAPGWRPACGQVGAAQGHLERQGVGVGDLFLFFGWFREVERGPDQGWRYRPDAPDRHVLFGWLQVGEVLRVGRGGLEAARASHPWLAYHPHLSGRRPEANNTLYVAAERLGLPGVDAELPGGGVFARARDALVLTAPGQRLRSLWSLPAWTRECRLSFHADPARWSAERTELRLRVVDQGQEFVADLADRPEAPSWLAGLFAGEAARLPQSSSHSGSASNCSLVMPDTRCSPSSRS
jgi:hypothetical protein